jgi:hypothetical protein
MPKPKPLPTGPEFRKEWARLDKEGRRRVRRASNRAEPAANRREAALAASMAVNQQRMWRVAWLVGPVLVALMRFADGWQVMLANLAVGLVIFGLMAAFFYRRAQKAERVNREAMAGKRPAQGARNAKPGAKNPRTGPKAPKAGGKDPKAGGKDPKAGGKKRGG